MASVRRRGAYALSGARASSRARSPRTLRSVALLLLFRLLCERRLRRRRGGSMRLRRVGRIWAPLPLLIARASVECRAALAAGLRIGLFLGLALRLALRFPLRFFSEVSWRLAPCAIAGFFVSIRDVIVRLAVAPRWTRATFSGRLALRSVGHRLDPDVVFLVGALDHGRKGIRYPLGNLELGRGVHDTDGADVLLVDAATTADHRQQPARFRVLASSNRGAKPHAAVRHALTRR